MAAPALRRCAHRCCLLAVPLACRAEEGAERCLVRVKVVAEHDDGKLDSGRPVAVAGPTEKGREAKLFPVPSRRQKRRNLAQGNEVFAERVEHDSPMSGKGCKFPLHPTGSSPASSNSMTWGVSTAGSARHRSA